MTHPNLLVGTKTSDDAAVYKLSDDLAVVLTVDFFPPIVDDPFIFGQIAAANSLSDVYAMGAKPIAALNVVGFPSDLDMSILGEILKGGASKALEAGIVIAGGHSVVDAEPKYGLSVTGIVNPGSQTANSTSKPGDLLLLTKPIGTGIITTAGKQEKVAAEVLENAVAIMAALNKSASESMISVGVNACSDVTGFGLLGHLREMMEGSGLGARIYKSKVPVIEGTTDLLEQGIAPGGTIRNLASLKSTVLWDKEISENDKILLSDAQTSGGLLISVNPDKADKLQQSLSEAGTLSNQIIGEVYTPSDTDPTIHVTG
jgi:selenide,water dikinase